ncbi:MAG: nucleotidyltransferase family protein [Thermoplasmatota archaeon]
MQCLIPAAGEGARMGHAAKALLRFGDRTALSLVVAAAEAAGLSPLVVSGAHRAEVEAEAHAVGAACVFNPAWEQGRTTSVQAGWAAAGTGAIALWPVDVPLVRAATVRRLLDAFEGSASGGAPGDRARPAPPPSAAPRKSPPSAESAADLTKGGAGDTRAFVPVFGGHRGHPIILSAGLRAHVSALAPEEPLFRVVRPYAVEVPVDDAGIHIDINTPEIYAEAQRAFASHGNLGTASGAPAAPATTTATRPATGTAKPKAPKTAPSRGGRPEA